MPPHRYRRCRAALAGLGVALAALCTAAAGCPQRTSTAVRSAEGSPGGLPRRATDDPLFSDAALKAGLTYRWTITAERPLSILQTIGNGCAFLDYDDDGNLDILLVGPRLGLFKGDGKGRFKDVSAAAGLAKLAGHFLGCATGDFDNDGYLDVYLSAYRGGALLRNERGKSFSDITERAGIRPQPWGTSCSFADINNDGNLDLYICNYVVFGEETPQLCAQKGYLSACGPRYYLPERGVLYLSDGAGRFRDVTRMWGADMVGGKALGVAIADYDGSGRQSIAIANDVMPGDLLRNTGAARFRNVGEPSGTAYDGSGNLHGGMGVDWGDFDNDGDLDLTVVAYQNEPKCVYRQSEGVFSECSTELGLAPALPYVAFGVKWLDGDNDGWLDLLIANGHVQDNVEKFDQTTYQQPTQFFLNAEGRRFSPGDLRLTEAARRPVVGRGLAVGDYDNDGRVDALVVDSEGTPLLLHNDAPRDGRHFLSCRLIGTKSNRGGIGALVRIEAGGRKQQRRCATDGSYLSASDPRVHFGLGGAKQVTRLTVRWPGGRTDTYADLAVDRFLTLREGGKIETAP